MKWNWNRCRRRQDTSLLAAGALDEKDKIELERHLAACEECRRYYGEIKFLTAPLAGWEKKLSAIEPTPAAQRRWAKAVQETEATSASCLSPLQNFWRIAWDELLWPSRYAWTGMAVLWVAMLAINAQLSDHRTYDAGRRAPSSLAMIQAWAEQNRVLAELAQPAFGLPAPPHYIARPRSQRRQDWAII
jgi:anti-sigma factor RsiW